MNATRGPERQLEEATLSSGPSENRGGTTVAGRSPAQLTWLRLRRDRTAVISGVTLVVLLVIALAAPLIEWMYGIGPQDQFQHALDRFGMPVGPAGGSPVSTGSGSSPDWAATSSSG
jgi:peptide/nickel transport system permease protein